MAALRIGIHKDRSSRVFQHLGTRLLASVSQSLLGIVHDEFLAKGIDKALGASADDELIRIGGGEADGVAYHIAPQATRGADNHGVVLVFLNAPQRNDVAPFHWLELVEHPIVKHQQHRLVSWVVLQTEEALTGIIGLHIMHVRRGNELLVLLAIRCKGHSSVEEHLQVRPNLLQMGLTCDFHHAVQNGEHP